VSGLDAAAVGSLYSALTSHAKTLGMFTDVKSHEPDSPAPKGPSLAIITGPITVAPSGLGETSLRWNVLHRIYYPRPAKPLEQTDPALIAAAMVLMSSLCSDLDLTGYGAPAGLVRAVEALAIEAEPKYLMQDGSEYRVIDVTVPITINDAFGQEVQ
jgi:hypothetical protein